MSGPKVVRVITREERVSQCQVLLARLEQSIVLWQEACDSLGQSNQSDTDKVNARRNDLVALFRADRFQDFIRRATDEVAFLESDIGRRKTLYLEAKAREAARRESGQQTARTLLSALKASVSAEDDLMKSLQLAASGALSREEVDKLLAQGFRSLTPAAHQGLSQSQRDLAKRLAGTGGAEILEQWVSPDVPADPRLQVVEQGIAELAFHAQPTLVAEFEKRLAAARSTADIGQRNLRLDSLSIEINSARLQAVKLSDLGKNIKLLDAELEAFGGETSQLRTTLRAAMESRLVEGMEAALRATMTALTEMQRQRAAMERRQAVLQGLAKLGYAVNAEMSTALASAGRVVVQKPDLHGYGIELVSPGDSARLQVRTVALTAMRDKSRDLDAETRWCSDFTKLKAEIEKSGSQLVIEQAKAVGEVPLRVVELQEEPIERSTDGKTTPGRANGAT